MNLKRALAGAFVVGFLLIPGLLHAGPRLSAKELVVHADAVAELQVDLRAGQSKVVRWLLKPDGVKVDPSGWNGLCVPDASLIRRWIETQAHLEGLPQWQQAEKDGGYTVLVFLRNHEGALRPHCEAESMLGLGWRSHPAFDAYLSAVIALLEAKAAKPPPTGDAGALAEKHPAPSPKRVPVAQRTGSSCF